MILKDSHHGVKRNACTSFITRVATALCVIVFLISGVQQVSAQCSITVNDGSMCAGTVPVTLTPAGGASSYIWTPAPGLTVVGSNASVWLTSAGTYTYTVTGTFTGGCTANAVATVTVSSVPVITVNPNPGMVCDGVPVVMTASGAETYAWFPDYCLTATTGSSVTAYTILTTTYIVIGTATNGCTGVTQFAIHNGITPQVVLNPNEVSCGLTSGSISAYGIGGSFSFNYLWSNGATTQSLDSISPGVYTVTVFDYSGCTATANTVVTLGTPPIISGSAQIATCNMNNGSIDVDVSGGVPPYNYTWSNGDLTQDLQNIVPGAYTVSVLGTDGCEITDSFIVGTTAPPIINLSPTNSTCGLPNGSISTTIANATLPYSFLWSNGVTNQNLTGIAADIYEVSFVDGAGCSLNDSIVVTADSQPLITIDSLTSSACGQSIGAIDISVNSGVAPFNYLWSNGFTTQDVVALLAGTHSVTVTDANGCTSTQSIAVQDALPPTITSNVTNEACSQNNGAIDLTVNGNGGYLYTWSGATASTEDLSSLDAGTYGVTVTDVLNCTVSAQIVVTSTTAPTLSTVVQDATCNVANGQINLTVQNGTQPFTYNWNNFQYSTEDITNLNGGTYNVTVTDFNGCTASTNNLLNIVPVPGLNATVTHTTCGFINGGIDLTVAGTSSPYTYNWNSSQFITEDVNNLVNGNYSVTVTDINLCTLTGTYVVNASQPISLTISTTVSSCNLANGTATATPGNGTLPYAYSWSYPGTTSTIVGIQTGPVNVIVTDAAGCSVTGSDIVNGVSMPVVSSAVASATCDFANGSIDLTVNGGTQPYTFSWDNGATTEDVTGLVGTHNVTVTDANNCSLNTVVNVSSSQGVTLSTNVTDEVCNSSDGVIDLTVTGVGPFIFNWNNNLYNTEDLNALVANVYDVIVTASNNCSATTTVNLINIPCAPTVVLVPTDATCGLDNGSIDLIIAGGTLPYVFNWSSNVTTEDVSGLGAGQHFVTITDGNNNIDIYNATINTIAAPTISVVSTNSTCGNTNGSVTSTPLNGTTPYTYLWTDGTTTQNVTSVAGGNFGVTLTDANNCTASASTVVNNIAGPTLSVTTVATQCGQSNGSVDLTVTGGTSSFTYSWNPIAATPDLNNVPAGNYNVTVTDANSCTATIGAVVASSNAPSITLTPVSSTCSNANGSVTSIVNGGLSPYTYLWNTLSTNTALTNINSGTYNLTVTDNAGCSISASTTVVNITGATIDGNVTSEACNQSNGLVDVSLIGGTAPFTYAWSLNGATSQDISGLIAGIYMITVTDANGCVTTNNFNVGFIAAPILSTNVTPATCDLNNGLVDVSINGGTGPYNFVWSDNQVTEDASQLAAGVYSVTITDDNNCTANASADVFSIAPSSIYIVGLPSMVCENQSFNLTAIGSSTYNWSPSTGLNTVVGDNVTVTALVNITYTVVATDVNGCLDTASVVVDPKLLPQVSVTGTYIGCEPLEARLQPDTFNVASAYWVFSNGLVVDGVSPTVTMNVGTYDAMMVAVSPLGCIDTLSIPNYIQALQSPMAEFLSTAGKGTDEHPATTFDFKNLSSHAHTYNWNYGDSTLNEIFVHPDHTYENPGTYLVTLIAMNSNGCSDTVVHEVTVEEPRLFFVPNTFTPNGDGNNDFFTLYGYNVASFRLTVFDRSGEKVYEGNEGSDPWKGNMHGKALNAGVYVYMAEVIYVNGKSAHQWGDITLIR